MKLTRREFLVLSALGLAGIGSIKAETAGVVSKRPLGNTGLDISILGFGNAIHFTEIFTPETSDMLFRTALKNGINFFDTEIDERADERMGRLPLSERTGIITSGKSYKRDARGLEQEALMSMKRMRLKCLDIMFLHALDRPDELDTVCGPGGGAEALRSLKKNNMIRFAGVSGHNSDILLEAVKRVPVDVVITPVNMTNMEEFKKKVCPELKRQGVGIIAMKPFDGGNLLKNPYFRFFVGTKNMLRYVWDAGVDCILVGIRKPDDLYRAVDMAKSRREMTSVERNNIESMFARYGKNIIPIHKNPVYLSSRRPADFHRVFPA
ncbi:MAG: aldo/keto reductase [Chloroflexi bacterium]|nr:aldo/keto reductase [Chloroflexota bacterium]